MNKTNILSSFFQLLAKEFKDSEGYNKFLILAMAANIPLHQVWIPYGTQAITIVLVGFFVKRYLKAEGARLLDKNMPRYRSSVYGAVGLTLLAQLVWIPYMSQLVTLVLLAILCNLAQKKSEA